MTIIYFILILGVVIFIHELGHFIFAKRAGIYVYEFALGMGPRIFKYKRNKKIKDKKGKITYEPDETIYSIRLFPIGGFVQMAGEDIEPDENIPPDKVFQAKPWIARLLTVIAGVVFNFILAIIILFFIGLSQGVTLNSTKLTDIDVTKYPTLVEGDRIVRVGGKGVNNYDKLILELQVQGTKEFTMQVKHADGTKENVTVSPEVIKDDKGDPIEYRYGFKITGDKHHDLWGAICFAFGKFVSTIEQMFFTVLYLFTGTLSLKLLSGPIGIYNIVGMASENGMVSLFSLVAFISINVGFINFLPLPAFDGGRILFLIIEKIKGSPVNPKVENTIHNVAFILLMVLMVYVTYNDIVKFF